MVKFAKFTLATDTAVVHVNPDNVCQVEPYQTSTGKPCTGITMSNGFTIPVEQPIQYVVDLLERP